MGNNDVSPQIIVATSTPIPQTWAVMLILRPSDNYGAARFGGTLQSVQPPFSSPPAAQLPSFPNPVYYQSGFNIQYWPLPSVKPITVGLYDTSTSCSPAVTIGSFTSAP